MHDDFAVGGVRTDVTGVTVTIFRVTGGDKGALVTDVTSPRILLSVSKKLTEYTPW